MKPTNVSIRAATGEDVDIVAALNDGLFQADGAQRDPFLNLNWPKEEGKSYFSTFLARPDHVCFLAETEADIIGYLAGYVEGPTNFRPVKAAELESMFVQEAYRSQGIGERLAREFLSWCRARGGQTVSVTAYAANAGAIQFYRRLGFTPMKLTLALDMARGAS